ncbi:sigma-54-dependent transcriptional regulator [Thalassotalea ganghwensis]
MSNTKHQATILIADDDEDIRLALSLLLGKHGYHTLEASDAKETLIYAQRHQPHLILLDMNFDRDTTSGQEGLAILQQLQDSQIPVILMTAWASVDLAVEGLKQGACDFIEKPWHNESLINRIQQHINYQQIRKEHSGYQQLLSHQESPLEWIATSAKMQNIEQLIMQVAPTDANILVLGENGTGKSLLAQRIHRLSKRQDKPFISLNMATIPENLFESELFGHQKGAFTDAKQNRTGRFQLAQQGTLFLDEIGSLPFTLQPKLLRVLETGEYEVLGTSNTQVADTRIISATNANLNKMVQDGDFRQDLLYRLNTLVIEMPALRDRLEDIPLLAEHFINKHCKKYSKSALTLSKAAINKLLQHTWPGNVRELSHVIERSVLMSTTTQLLPEHLLIEHGSHHEQGILVQPLEKAERQLIEKALQQSQGSVTQAAALLDISRNALYRRLDKFNIHYES